MRFLIGPAAWLALGSILGAGIVAAFMSGSNPGDPTFMDYLGKQFTLSGLSLVHMLFGALIVLVIGGLLRLEPARKLLAPAYSAIVIGLALLERVRTRIDDPKFNLNEIGAGLAIFLAGALIGCSHFAASIISALIGLLATVGG